ncbi:hypothetical protein [Shimazuella alba]|uniref:Uncharacterized protein n=1 Tax=Shimazuella alba TaxID=2690964 RepID=A0A6I4W4T0_9BACL|nr:hypothetical protein [Shimazuella alba]MXQ55312.1 hypothetical protein [Shimazuella alba]
MKDNKLTITKTCIPGTKVHSLYLWQGKCYYIFPDLTSETRLGDITVFTTLHHTVYVDGDRRFKVQPNGDSKKRFFSTDKDMPGTVNMRSRFGIWLQVIGHYLFSAEDGQEPEHLINTEDPKLEEDRMVNDWWFLWLRDNQRESN